MSGIALPDALDAMQRSIVGIIELAGRKVDPSMGVSVIVDRSAHTASIVHRTNPVSGAISCRVIFPIAPAVYRLTKAQFDRWVAYFLHEVSHALYTDNDAWRQAVQEGISALVNGLEDVRIERELIAAGTAANAGPMLHGLIEGILAETPASFDPSAYENAAFAFAVYGRKVCNRYPVNTDALDRKLTPAMRAIFERFLPRLAKAQSTLEICELAREIIKAYPPVKRSPQPPAPQPPALPDFPQPEGDEADVSTRRDEEGEGNEGEGNEADEAEGDEGDEADETPTEAGNAGAGNGADETPEDPRDVKGGSHGSQPMPEREGDDKAEQEGVEGGASEGVDTGKRSGEPGGANDGAGEGEGKSGGSNTGGFTEDGGKAHKEALPDDGNEGEAETRDPREIKPFSLQPHDEALAKASNALEEGDAYNEAGLVEAVREANAQAHHLTKRYKGHRYGLGYGFEDLERKAAKAGKLRQQVCRVLKSEEIDEYEGGKPSGRLNSRTLTRAVVGSSANVFARRNTSEGYQTSVLVLVDASGSMGGGNGSDTKMGMAATLALVIAQACQQVAAKCDVVLFQERSSYAVKRSGDRITADEVKQAFASLNYAAQGGTPLSMSMVKHGAKLAVSGAGTRKILFAITDGGCNQGAGVVRKTADYLEKVYGIETVGLSIDSPIHGAFKHEAKISSTQSVADAGLGLIVRALEGGRRG